MKFVAPSCSPSLRPPTDVVQQFGIESILIYNALLLKKRVAVYASSVETLLTTCRFALATNVTQSFHHILWLNIPSHWINAGPFHCLCGIEGTGTLSFPGWNWTMMNWPTLPPMALMLLGSPTLSLRVERSYMTSLLMVGDCLNLLVPIHN